MARLARYIEDNGYYHVISRSINHAWIFKDEADFLRFRMLERKAKQRFPIRLFHYVFMNTHFHLVLQASTKTTLSAHLAYVKWHYTQWMRRKYGWRGPLWRERYKSLPIENESYLTACGTYVECNPVRAGMCRDPADYPFSSYRKYHQGLADDIVDEYEAAGSPETLMLVNYETANAKAIFSRASAIGSPWFIEEYRSKRNACPQKCSLGTFFL